MLKLYYKFNFATEPKLLNDSIRMMWLSQNQKPSYKTINRFRVNPKVDVLLEALFIQFHSQCLKQNLIDD